MTKVRAEQLRYFDVLSAASLTFWFGGSVVLIAYALLIEQPSLIDFITLFLMAILISIFAMIFTLPFILVFAGVFSLPIWIILKISNHLNQWTVFGTGGFAGMLASILFLNFPMTFSGDTYWGSFDGYVIATILITLGSISGWNGYRVAWDGRVNHFRPERKNNP